MIKPALLLVILLGVTATAMNAGAAGERVARIERLRQLLSTHAGDPRVLLRLGSEYVFLADETERHDTVEEARRILNRASEAGAGPEARAWMGLLRCVEAKYGSGATARALAQDGLHELDAAVELEPENLKFRLMRASVCLRVPREWKRLEQAKDDLLVTELSIRRDPARIGHFDLDAAEVYFKLGQAHLGNGEMTEARTAWQRAQKAVPTSRYAREAERLLRRHGS